MLKLLIPLLVTWGLWNGYSMNDNNQRIPILDPNDWTKLTIPAWKTPNFLWRALSWIVPDSYIENNFHFYLYTRSNLDVPQQLWLNNNSSLRHSNFNPLKKTVIVLHGFSANYLMKSAQGPKNELLKYEDVNVILPDYGQIDFGLLDVFFIGYFMTVVCSFKIGTSLGAFIKFLIDQGVNPNNVQIVGHSIGAHIAGFAGKYTQKQGLTLGRITGLDPCNPMYEFNDEESRLSSTDASFTDCIFTTYGVWGMGIPVCQANYFPNGVGISQPGCYRDDAIFLSSCGHSRVVDLYMESIDPASKFSVQRCWSVPRVSDPIRCWSVSGTYMGQYANPKDSGLYYLRTNAKPPYSQG